MNTGRKYLSIIAVIFVSLVVLVAPQASDSVESLVVHIQDKASFGLRVALGREPKIDPRLKILLYDDLTAQKTSLDGLWLDDYSSVLRSLDKRHPRAIIIDKVFQRPRAVARSFDEIKNFVANKTQLSTKISAAAYIKGPLLAGKNQITLPASLLLASAEESVVPSVDLVGPGEAIHGAFDTVGLVNYSSNSRVTAFVAGNSGVAASLGLHAAASLAVADNHLLVDGASIPVDGSNRIIVNLISPSTLQRTKPTQLTSMYPVLLNTNKGRDIELIKEGDVVLILPGAFTGGADFHDSGIGRIFGGYLHAAVANSALTGQWIRPFTNGLLTTLVGLLLALFVYWATLSSKKNLRISVAFAPPILCIGAGLFLFSFANIYFHWLPISFCMFAGGIGGIRDSVHRIQRIQTAVRSMVSENLYNIITKNPELVENFDAVQRDLTCMYVDYASFSLMSENEDSRYMYQSIQQKIRRNSKVVHDHDGIVLGSTGDGFVAIFGFSFTEALDELHADKAVKAAIDIQRQEAGILASLPSDSPVTWNELPVRIGINSGNVVVGASHVDARFEMSVFGDAMNEGKRLEDRAESFRIMLGESTYKRIAKLKIVNDPSLRFFKRLMQKKHHGEDYFDAWEIDPFILNPETREAGLRRINPLARKAKRFTPEKPTPKIIINGRFSGEIVDVSDRGLAFVSQESFAKKSKISIKIEDRFRSTSEIDFVCEVRWGTAIRGGNNYLHGVSIEEYSDVSKQFLNRICDDDNDIEVDELDDRSLPNVS